MGSMMLELPTYRSDHKSRRANSDSSEMARSSMTSAGAGHGEDKENDGLVAALEINGTGNAEVITSWQQCQWDKWSPQTGQIVPVWFHVDYRNPKAQQWLRESGPKGANIGRHWQQKWNAKYASGMAAKETNSWRALKHPVARNRMPGNFPPK